MAAIRRKAVQVLGNAWRNFKQNRANLLSFAATGGMTALSIRLLKQRIVYTEQVQALEADVETLSGAVKRHEKRADAVLDLLRDRRVSSAVVDEAEALLKRGVRAPGAEATKQHKQEHEKQKKVSTI